MSTIQEEPTVIDPAPTGEITYISAHGLPATSRCVRCGAQAYAEVEVWDTGKPHENVGLSALRPGSSTKRMLEFCAHHFTENFDVLVQTAVRIVDYRPFLQVQEKRFKGIDER